MKDQHPCGALPVSGWTVSIWYCHHHQAFFGSYLQYVQDDGDDVMPFETDSTEFGPFDSFTDAQLWAATKLSAIEGLATLPGDVITIRVP